MLIEYAKTWVKEAYHDLVLANKLPVEPYKIYIKPGYDTALWSYDPPHHIIIGTEIFSHMRGRAMDDRRSEAFFLSFFYHEIGHSKFTDRDLKKLNATLKKKQIPFSLFNIFEDARIEEKMRRFMKRDFNWAEYIPLETPQEPLDLFFYFLHYENDTESLRSVYIRLPDKLKLDFKKIYGFYREAVEAATTEALIPVVEKWRQTYRAPPEMHRKNRRTITGRKVDANYPNDKLFGGENHLLQDPKSKDELLEGAELALSFNSDDDAMERAEKKHFRTIEKLTSANLLLPKSRAVHIDPKARKMLEKAVEQLFQRERKYRTVDRIPTKRIDIRRLVLKNDRFYKKTHTKTEIDKKTLTVVLDMSGSMQDVMDKMLLLVLVVNSLAQKGYVEGHLVLSATDFNDRAQCQTFSFPIDEDMIYRIDPRFGGEGLAHTLAYTLDILKKSDYVWVYTDGFLTDDPIDKGFFHKHGIYTYGIYLGEGYNASEDLKRWFDYIICRNNVKDLARDLMMLIRRR